MFNDFRFRRGGVFSRVLGISTLVALLFVAGCTTNGGTQFTVTTTSGQLAKVAVNSVYAGTTLTAANGTAPYTWKITSGTLPPGMSLSAAGVLSGTPTQSGAFTFTVAVTDSANPSHTASASLTLTVGQAPAITSANSTTLTVGTSGTFTVTATGFPAPTFSETGALPAGVTLNSTSGALSGTPGAGTGGTYPVTITAQNGTTPNATQNFTLTVDQAPAITSQNSTTFVAGAAGTFTVTTTGFPAPTLSETGALPTGVTFNSTTGVLSGTPAGGTQGNFPIVITSQNGIGANATQNFTLTVGVAPAITSGNSATFTVGTGGTFTVTATGFPAPTFSETGALPSGVTLNSTTGVLTGTPAAGTGKAYPITITAQNGIGSNATQSFTLTVDQAPAITSQNSAAFSVGAAGSFTVTATGFPAPTFSETGALPTGVSLNATTGVLGGTPASGTQGSYPIVITAQNGVGANATQNFTLTVNLAPAITSGTSTTFTVATPGTFTVTASGFPAPTFSETGALPSGVTLNSTTGVLSGTPGAGTGGAYTVTITAQNGVSPNATQSFTLTVDQAPAINSANNATFAVGSPGTFTVNATGFPAPTFSETGVLPGGVSLNSTTGVLSGTPNPGTQGSYPITITAQNGIGVNATQNFTLTVDVAPAITSGNSTTFTVGSAGTFTVTATGTPAPTFSETGALPGGVTLNSTTGVLAGTPAANTGGTYPITITATNGVGTPATQGFTLTVDQSPAFTSANNTTFAVGSASTFTVLATGFPAPTFSETGTLPTGISLSSTGVLSGTPGSGTQGSYPIIITAQNGVGANATQNFTLTVSFTAPPSFTSSNSTTFTVGAAGTFTVTASGAPAPTFSETGTLPSGVTLNSTTGVLSGTPAANAGGTYPISIKAHNGIGTDATQSFTLTVDQAPSITSGNSATFTVGASGSFSVTATGFPSPTFSESGILPSGVTLNTSTGLLSGTPASGTQGSYPIVITAQNGVGTNATQNFTLTVNTAPSFTSSATTTFTVGTPGTFNVTAAGSPAPSLGENGTLPNGVSFNASTGLLSGTPATGTGGVYSITFTAQNGITPNATQNFSLTVDEGTAITSSNTATFTVGVSQTFNMSATGEPAATLSESGALPSGVTFTPNPSGGSATLSGTPATGTSGNYPITITAHNGIGTDATQNFTLTVITDPCASIVGGSESLLNGHYAFLLRGFDNGTTGSETSPEPALIGGVLTFNGINNNGSITAGTLDMNLNGTAGVLSQSVTGTYKVGSDHRGCLAINISGGSQHYRFSLGNISGGVASTGHMVNFDGPGPFTTGVLRKQDTTAFSTSKVTGNYVFEIASPQNTAPSAGGKQAVAGIIRLSNGTVTGGEFDINDEGNLDGSSSLTSWPSSAGFTSNPGTSYSIDATTGRGTLSNSVTINGTTATFQDIIYVVSSGDFLILTNFDQTQLNGLAGTGEALQQSAGTFSNASISGNMVIYLSSLQLNGGVGSINPPTSDPLIGTINVPSAGNFTFNAWDNNGGSINPQGPQTGTYSIDSTGRMLLTGASGGNHPPVFYIVSANKAFILGSSPGVETGMFEPQSSTTLSSTGPYAFGTINPEDPNVNQGSGAVTFTGGSLSGTSDSNSNGSFNPDGAISGTYSTDSTTGLVSIGPSGCVVGATGSTGCRIIIYVISPTRFVLMNLLDNSGAAKTNSALQIGDQ